MSSRAKASKTLSVVIAEKNADVLAALEGLLETYDDIEIVGRAASCTEGAALVSSSRPDVVVLGCELPSAACLVEIEHVRRTRSDLRIVVLTLHGDFATSARAAGADAVVVKGAPTARLIEEIRGETLSPAGRPERTP